MLTLGAVSYLNTKPLVAGLERRLHEDVDPAARLVLDLPSRLATSLARGELDVALIPTVEFFRGTNYRLVSDAVIACRGPVWSVRLLSRVPIENIKTLALDEGSRTSQALVSILLWEQFGLKPKLLPFPIDQAPESVDADALLVIGDRAMHPAIGTYQEIWDLGDRWCRWTELPFVFAVWAAREGLAESGVSLDRIASILEASRDEGLQCFEAIAAKHAGPLGLTTADCESYFSRNLHFKLGASERLGMERFRKALSAQGLLNGLDGIPTNKSLAASANAASDLKLTQKH